MSSASNKSFIPIGNPNVPRIIRDENHIYHDELKTNYTSVTTLIGNFKVKFDTEKISKAYSEKHSIPQDQVKENWKKQCLDACEKGSLLHDLMEKGLEDIDAYVKAEMNNYHSPVLARDVMSSEDLLQFENKDKYKITDEPLLSFRIERLIKGIGGGVDRLVEERDTNIVHVRDWKTNKVISRSGFRGNTMNFPLSHLQDCNFSHYTLQLSLYAFILETTYKKKIGTLGIHHFDYVAEKVYFIPIEYRKEDIQNLLAIHFYNNIMKKVC